MTYNKNDPLTIQNMFNSIAKRYDRANAVLSFQLHKYWNRELVRQVVSPQNSHTLLDLCCGTGDIALEYIKKSTTPCHAYLIDFCSNMLECAKTKMALQPFSDHKIQFIEADAQAIPLQDETIDCTTMAYGIRNIKDPALCMREVYRVLKPGGRFGILELTQPNNFLLRTGHRFYLKTILPILGKWLTSNPEAYQYLQSSIQNFIAPSELENIMKQSKFVNTKRLSLGGGIATILIGTK